MIEVYQGTITDSEFGLSFEPTTGTEEPAVRIVQRFEEVKQEVDIVYDHDIVFGTSLIGGTAAYPFMVLTIFNPDPDTIRVLSPDLHFLDGGFQPEGTPISETEMTRRQYARAWKEIYITLNGNDYSLSTSGNFFFGPYVIYDIQTGYRGRDFVIRVQGWSFDRATLQNFRTINLLEGQNIFQFFTEIQSSLNGTEPPMRRNLFWRGNMAGLDAPFRGENTDAIVEELFTNNEVNGVNLSKIVKTSRSYPPNENLVNVLGRIASDNDLVFIADGQDFIFSRQGEVSLPTAPSAVTTLSTSESNTDRSRVFSYTDGSLLENVTVENYQNIRINVIFSPHVNIFDTIFLEFDPTTLDTIFFSGINRSSTGIEGRDFRSLLVVDIRHNMTHDGGVYTQIVGNARGYFDNLNRNIPSEIRQINNPHRSVI